MDESANDRSIGTLLRVLRERGWLPREDGPDLRNEVEGKFAQSKHAIPSPALHLYPFLRSSTRAVVYVRSLLKRRPLFSLRTGCIRGEDDREGFDNSACETEG